MKQRFINKGNCRKNEKMVVAVVAFEILTILLGGYQHIIHGSKAY
jgi:hypothetical protein